MEQRINRIHERTLRLIYPNHHQLTLKELLAKNKTVSIHQRNLQTLATEIYKAKDKVSPSFLIQTTILEMRQFLKGRDISQSIMEVKVFYHELRKYRNLFQIQSER